jgi:hypothetical protein
MTTSVRSLGRGALRGPNASGGRRGRGCSSNLRENARRGVVSHSRFPGACRRRARPRSSHQVPEGGSLPCIGDQSAAPRRWARSNAPRELGRSRRVTVSVVSLAKPLRWGLNAEVVEYPTSWSASSGLVEVHAGPSSTVEGGRLHRARDRSRRCGREHELTSVQCRSPPPFDPRRGRFGGLGRPVPFLWRRREPSTQAQLCRGSSGRCAPRPGPTRSVAGGSGRVVRCSRSSCLLVAPRYQSEA